MPQRPARSVAMDSRSGPASNEDPETEEFRSVVPARAVLTELARGFLLVHDSNPEQAILFAESFLKEQTGRLDRSRAEPTTRVSRTRLNFGRFPRGAVEPPPTGTRERPP